MKLETQLGELSALGLDLNPGVTVDDLLYGFDRASYEDAPFDLLLFYLGAEVEREPWNRRVCDRVWNFDTECISQTGDYVRIVKNLCALSGDPAAFGDLADSIDLETGEAWLAYTVGGQRRHWSLEVNSDWADMLTLTSVMSDLEWGGRQFYWRDNGQPMILFFLEGEAAAQLGHLCGEPLNPCVPA